MKPKIGDIAPDFELLDQDGVSHKLSDYLGMPVVLYFYPKDNTPGCTTQACSFRDSFAKYKQKGGITVLGSAKTVSSHMQSFKRNTNCHSYF